MVGSIPERRREVTVEKLAANAVMVSGQSSVWDGWTNEDVRRALHHNLRRSLADLKRTGYIDGDPDPHDQSKYVSLMPKPNDILVVFTGGEENTHCAVIPSWGTKIASTSVTRVVGGSM